MPKTQETRRKLKYPDRKISETLLDFASPLLEIHGPNISETQMEKSLNIAFTVWNAVAYADLVNKTHILEMVRSPVGKNRAMLALLEGLIQRKRTHFGDDERLIGFYEIFRRNGEMRVRAEARDPFANANSKRRP